MKTLLTEVFSLQNFFENHGDDAVIMFLHDNDRGLRPAEAGLQGQGRRHFPGRDDHDRRVGGLLEYRTRLAQDVVPVHDTVRQVIIFKDTESSA